MITSFKVTDIFCTANKLCKYFNKNTKSWFVEFGQVINKSVPILPKIRLHIHTVKGWLFFLFC